MNIHEYQAKELLRNYSLPLLKGFSINEMKNIDHHIQKLNGPPWIVKSQIHAGGRGAGYFIGKKNKIRGVTIAKTYSELISIVKFMLGNTLITRQTGEKGKKVNTVYIEEGCLIEKEFYLSILVDRKSSKILLMVSSSGGINIEEVAIKTPNKIFKYFFDNINEVNTEELKSLAKKLSLNVSQSNEFIIIINKLLKVFKDLDATTIEINPLVTNNEGTLLLLDAKMVIDDNSLFRQPDIIKLRDESEEDPLELEASKNKMNYVKLEGTIGCMVNGAGLAMATMDIIKHYGCEPANFLDLGGTADKNRAIEGFKIIQSDPNVKVILINIFGGIIRCDMIAEGIISAAVKLKIKIPIVVRFQGTNAKKGRDAINNSKLNIIAANNLSDAAKKAVEKSYL